MPQKPENDSPNVAWRDAPQEARDGRVYRASQRIHAKSCDGALWIGSAAEAGGRDRGAGDRLFEIRLTPTAISRPAAFAASLDAAAQERLAQATTAHDAAAALDGMALAPGVAEARPGRTVHVPTAQVTTASAR